MKWQQQLFGVTLPHSESKVIVFICTSETNTITIELDSAEPCSQTRVLALFGPGYEWPGHGRPARPARYTLANAPQFTRYSYATIREGGPARAR
jgi:hypothetical protein